MLLTLAEVAECTEMLDVACSRCSRRGRLSVRRLVAQHGPGTPLRRAVAHLNADCPNRVAHAIQARCDVYFPYLAALMGVSGA
jgi:hypothetical protein